MWVLNVVVLLTTLIYLNIGIHGADLQDILLKFACSKGDLFKLDCNVCMCDAQTEKFVVCSTYYCRKRPRHCKSYSTYKKNCNKCSCQPGGMEFCTLNQCDSNEK